MKKSKGQTVDLLYVNKKEVNRKRKSKQKNTTKKKKTVGKKGQKVSNEKINLDNEIVIGLTPKEEPKNIKNTKKTKNTKPGKIKNKKTNLNKKSVSKSKKSNKDKEKKNSSKKKNLKIIKWVMVIMLFATAVILFMLSSVFNIKEIIVISNSKVSSEEIINLSTLVPEVNMFKFTNKKIRNGVKENAYVEDVKIKRNINGTITLDIKERIPTYMLKFSNANVYINNQGYILEISDVPLELPTISGFETPEDNISVGNRLIVEDLKKLEDIIKIMETARGVELADIITGIDISESSNYILTIESEGKTVQFGDCSNANVKLLKVKAILEKEKGVQGEIYFQDLERTIFREKV